jgi:hypothetical protein
MLTIESIYWYIPYADFSSRFANATVNKKEPTRLMVLVIKKKLKFFCSIRILLYVSSDDVIRDFII